VGKPLSVGGRVAADLITDLQFSHQKVLKLASEMVDCAAQDDCTGVLKKLAELFPELNEQKTMLFELDKIRREAGRRVKGEQEKSESE
jgi:hypothetical protein